MIHSHANPSPHKSTITELLIFAAMLLPGLALAAPDCGNDYAFPYTLGTELPADLETDLQYAVECANANATDDVIDLDGQTVSFSSAPSAYDLYGFNALEPINSSSTNGALTVQNGVIERVENVPNCDGGTDDRAEFRFFNLDPSADVTLQDLTFRNGCASDVSADDFDDVGGAVLSLVANLTVYRTSFEGNQAADVGGAI